MWLCHPVIQSQSHNTTNHAPDEHAGKCLQTEKQATVQLSGSCKQTNKQTNKNGQQSYKGINYNAMEFYKSKKMFQFQCALYAVCMRCLLYVCFVYFMFDFG